jgi:hypothetical protein
VSVAYVILAHRSPSQLARLLHRLHHPDDHAFVHIDRRVALEPFREALAPLLATGNVHFARRRLRTPWGGFGFCAAVLATLEQALQGAIFTHVSLLSGQDYPLVPASALRDFFEAAGERSFLSYSSGDGKRPPARAGNLAWYWNGDLRRVTYRHYRVRGHFLHIPNRYMPGLPRLAPPAEMKLYQGSAWWTLSRAAAHYTVETFVRRRTLRRYFRRVMVPDEFLFQMVLCNSDFMPTIVNDDLHFIHWDGWHPKLLERADLSAIAQSFKLFARKLDEERDHALLDELDSLADARAADPGAFVDELRRHYLDR